MSNLKMVRIQAKIDELFKELVDLSDEIGRAHV